MSTDYTSYVIVYSCENYVASAYLFSEYSWVLTRDKIEAGTADYDAMMAKVDKIYKEKLPDYDHQNEMRTTKQGGDCKYFL